VPTPAGQPGLPGSDDRAADQARDADPVAVRRLRRHGRDQQLGGLAVRSAPPTTTVVEAANDIVIANEVAAALRDLQLLDTDCERLVLRTRAHHGGAVLAASDDDLDELIGSVAAEANHELNRRRQQRLDAAFGALNDAAADGW
jgi:hypothetical protein